MTSPAINIVNNENNAEKNLKAKVLYPKILKDKATSHAFNGGFKFHRSVLKLNVVRMKSWLFIISKAEMPYLASSQGCTGGLFASEKKQLKTETPNIKNTKTK